MGIYFEPLSRATYSVWLKNLQGQYLAILDQIEYLQYGRLENNIGSLKLVLPNDRLKPLLQKDFVLEVWRKLPGKRFYLEGETEWRIRKIRTTESSLGTQVELTAFDTIELLNRPVAAYYAGTSYTSKSGAAGSVMRAVVLENAGSGASSADRWFSGGFSSSFFGVEADKALGATVTASVVGRKILNILRDLADQSEDKGSPIFFDVVPTGQNQLQFRTFAGQRGMDLRGLVMLSTKFGTLEEAVVTEDYSDGYNVVLAAGGGQEESRLVSVASSAANGPFDVIEKFVDARQITVQASLDDAAEEALAQGGGRLILEGQVGNVPGLRYGVHYGFGSRLSCGIGDTVYTARVSAIEVTVQRGQETIRTGIRIDG